MLTEDDRRRAAEMTEDMSIWNGNPLATAMAVVLQRHVNQIAELGQSIDERTEVQLQQLREIDGLKARTSELTSERDHAMEDLHRLTDAFECSEHIDAIHMVRCTACGKERHVPA